MNNEIMEELRKEFDNRFEELSIYMSKEEIQEWWDWFQTKLKEERDRTVKIIDEVSDIHPYKEVGNSDSYSSYNEGWSDACDRIQYEIEGEPKPAQDQA